MSTLSSGWAPAQQLSGGIARAVTIQMLAHVVERGIKRAPLNGFSG
jgi:hypothetical protein